MPEQPAPTISTDLTGQVALVTGASRGLGRAIAQSLARCGASVACVARDEAKLKETIESITGGGGTATALTCDVTDGQSVEQTISSVVEKWQRLDILVNNAGITGGW